MSDKPRCVSWEHATQVMGLSRDIKEATDNVTGSPYTTRYPVVRVRLEGEGVSGELLVANHDAPQIGDLFKVTFERYP